MEAAHVTLSKRVDCTKQHMWHQITWRVLAVALQGIGFALKTLSRQIWGNRQTPCKCWIAAGHGQHCPFSVKKMLGGCNQLQDFAWRCTLLSSLRSEATNSHATKIDTFTLVKASANMGDMSDISRVPPDSQPRKPQANRRLTAGVACRYSSAIDPRESVGRPEESSAI